MIFILKNHLSPPSFQYIFFDKIVKNLFNFIKGGANMPVKKKATKKVTKKTVKKTVKKPAKKKTVKKAAKKK